MHNSNLIHDKTGNVEKAGKFGLAQRETDEYLETAVAGDFASSFAKLIELWTNPAVECSESFFHTKPSVVLFS